MDIASILGLIGAIAVMTAAMVTSSDIGAFINTPSLLVVFGGSIFAMLTRYGLGQFFQVFGTVKKSLFGSPADIKEIFDLTLNFADIARKDGFLGLQEIEIEDSFFRKAIGLIVDGSTAEAIENNLEQDIELTVERHMMGINFFKKLGDVAPAMGMIGTLIGLVSMLVSMDDPKTIGPSMSVALLTTMYGSMIANMISLPIADKLELRMNEIVLARKMVLEASLSIHAGSSPMLIESSLKNYFKESIREDINT